MNNKTFIQTMTETILLIKTPLIKNNMDIEDWLIMQDHSNLLPAELAEMWDNTDNFEGLHDAWFGEVITSKSNLIARLFEIFQMTKRNILHSITTEAIKNGLPINIWLLSQDYRNNSSEELAKLWDTLTFDSIEVAMHLLHYQYNFLVTNINNIDDNEF